MSRLVRCKACGYVMKQSRLGDVCPACALAAKVFQPHEDRISPRRSFILNLDLHPILVHFSQAFAAVLPALVAMSIFFPNFYGQEFVVITCFFVFTLPPTTVAALASGLIDGRVKLKQLRAPDLVRKIVTGSSLLALSAANAAIVLLGGFNSGTKVYVLALSLACLACAVILGMIGKRLIPVILPG